MAAFALASAALATSALASDPDRHMSIMTFYDLNASAQCGWTTHSWAGLGQSQDAVLCEPFDQALDNLTQAQTQCGTQGWIMLDPDMWNPDEDWQGNIRNFTSELQPWVQNGTVSGVILGHELNLDMDRMVGGLALLRKGLGKDVLLSANELAESLSGWPYVPADLDFVSFGRTHRFYDEGNHDGLLEANWMRDWTTKVVIPKLNHSGQNVLLVPAVYGNDPDACEANKQPCPMDEQKREIVKKLDALFEFAKEEPRVAGFNPWHFNSREYLPYPSEQGGWNKRLGPVDMPEVLAKLQEIGKFIHGNAQSTVAV